MERRKNIQADKKSVQLTNFLQEQHRKNTRIDCIEMGMAEKSSVNKSNRKVLSDQKVTFFFRQAQLGEFRQNTASIKRYNIYASRQEDKEAEVSKIFSY